VLACLARASLALRSCFSRASPALRSLLARASLALHSRLARASLALRRRRSDLPGASERGSCRPGSQSWQIKFNRSQTWMSSHLRCHCRPRFPQLVCYLGRCNMLRRWRRQWQAGAVRWRRTPPLGRGRGKQLHSSACAHLERSPDIYPADAPVGHTPDRLVFFPPPHVHESLNPRRVICDEVVTGGSENETGQLPKMLDHYAKDGELFNAKSFSEDPYSLSVLRRAGARARESCGALLKSRDRRGQRPTRCTCTGTKCMLVSRRTRGTRVLQHAHQVPCAVCPKKEARPCAHG